jgi:hypothetical protein
MEWKIDGTKSIEVMQEKANAHGRYAVTAYGNNTSHRIGFASSDAEAKSMARKWLNRHAPEEICRRWARKLGLGFHPDTSGANYSPAMSDAQIRTYDAEMRSLFKWAADPYAIAIEAWRAEGVTPEEKEQDLRDQIANSGDC